jgi:hypothetical protein
MPSTKPNRFQPGFINHVADGITYGETYVESTWLFTTTDTECVACNH